MCRRDRNYGAGKWDRVYKSIRVNIGISYVFTGMIIFTLYAFCEPMYHMFTTDPKVIDIGAVSYTHLDVYKRQALFCVMLHIFEKQLKKWFQNPYLRVFVGGVTVVLLWKITGTDTYLGLGGGTIEMGIRDS